MNKSNPIKIRKKLFAAIASCIIGESSDLKFKGNNLEIDTLREAINASRGLYLALNENDANMEQVVPLIEKKHIAAQKFESIFGFSWLL